MLYMEWIGKVGGAVTMERFRESPSSLRRWQSRPWHQPIGV